MKKFLNVKNGLCSVLVICCLSSCSVFANDEVKLTDKELQKCVVQMKMDSLSDEYLMSIEQLLYNQLYKKQYEQALNTAQYLIDASKKYYGAEHSKTGFAYIVRADVYQCMGLWNKSIQDLDSANLVYKKNKTDYSLLNKVMFCYFRHYRFIEQYDKAISYLQQINAKEYQFGSFSLYNDFAEVYSQNRNIKKAEEYYTKEYKYLVANNLTVSDSMFYYYLQKAGYYQVIGSYSNALKNIEEAETLLSKLEDNDKRLLLALNKSKIMCLNELKYFDESLTLLVETEKLAEKYGDTYDKEHINSYYVDLYRDKKEPAKAYKYFNKIEKSFIGLPSDSLNDLFPISEKKIDLYWDMHEHQKAYDVLNCTLKKLDMQKENAPALYAHILLKKVNLDKETQKFDDAKLAIETVLEYYKKAVPENSYALFDVYKRYGELYEFQGKNKEALKYFYKAQDINVALLGNCNKDLAELYENIANNIEDFSKAIEYINKSIEIAKSCYGENHVVVYSRLISKYHLYNKFGKTDKANQLLSQINDAITSNSIKGYADLDVYYRVNLINAYKSIENNDYKNAEVYANKALEYAKTKRDKQELYGLKYQIYLNLGNKLKAAKYKKLANISE